MPFINNTLPCIIKGKVKILFIFSVQLYYNAYLLSSIFQCIFCKIAEDSIKEIFINYSFRNSSIVADLEEILQYHCKSIVLTIYIVLFE